MKLTARFMHQWQFLRRKCNWYDFNFIKLYVEDDRVFNKVYLEVWLLGLGFEVCWNYRLNHKGRELAAKIKGWQDMEDKHDRDN